jgi:predicted SnoaL-like aldol condensation-catalyzing enzyme
MMMDQSNKNIVAQFYKEVIGKRDTSLIYTLVREDYIQHSPAGKDGRAGLLEMVEYLKTLPPSIEPQSPVKMLLADDDMVAGLLDIKFMGKRMLVLDLFRLQDGMLAEHWDAVQEISSDIVIPHFNVDEQVQGAEVNKELIGKQWGGDLRRVIGEGDIVVAQSAVTVDGKLHASYDICRMANGAIVDQLSVSQVVPDAMMHKNGMI